MKRLIGFIIFVGLIWLLYATCPTKEDHTASLSKAMPEFFNKQMGAAGLDVAISEDPEVQALINKIGSHFVDVDNYLLVSIGRETITGDEQIVSFGIAGHVFTFADEIVQDAGKLIDKVSGSAKEAAVNKLTE